MRVREVMNTPVFTCAPESSLQSVARQMIDEDCGVLPVLDDRGGLAGIVTDRDVCRVFGREGSRAVGMRVGDAMTRGVFTCRDSDEIETALDTMGLKQVRRLPVIDDAGALRGILSLDDVVVRAEKEAPDGISYDELVGTFRNLCSHRLLSRHAPAAAR